MNETITTTPLEAEFTRFAGELAASLSFNKSIGQIFGLLYLSAEPLSLDEISKRLHMSKGNASINLRHLERWGAVRPVALSATRRDHYQDNTNLKEIALRRLTEGVSRRLDLVDDRLKDILALQNESKSLNAHQKKKLQELNSLISKGRSTLSLLPKLLKFLP
jgi:DNA-binding transcriptional regulator GbsR (MarR family)